METIDRQQLKAKLDASEDIKLVMTVGGWTFRAKHIPGSLGFPSPRCALQALRHDDEIIVYSTSHHRQDPRAAFDALKAHGYRNVHCYIGGLADWEDAGYSVEGTSVGSTATRRWPHGHSPRGRELDGGCPHCDNGWSGYGWPPPGTADEGCLGGHQRQPTRNAARGHPRGEEAVRYEIRVQGVLDQRWSSWFDGLQLTSQPGGVTVLAGPVTDQAALHGLLAKVRDLGLPLLSVRRLDQE